MTDSVLGALRPGPVLWGYLLLGAVVVAWVGGLR
jgi:hypothetical protein